MPLDAICLSAVKNELHKQILGTKIEKVQQPERDVVVLSLRGMGKQTQKLLISAGADDARAHLTEHKFDNPKAPPMFCMLLRKHIIGALITDITQLPSERVLIFNLKASGTFGEQIKKCLIIEMIGRLSNIILTDSEGIIIDCSRRIGGELTGKRSVLPGLLYRDPPPQEGKTDPLSVTGSVLQEMIDKAEDTTLDRWLISKFTAFSPLICREIAWRAYGESDYRTDAIQDNGAALLREFFALTAVVKAARTEPWLLVTDNAIPKDFSFTRIEQYENMYRPLQAESFSHMLDGFYTRSEQIRRLGQRSAATLKTMVTAKDRLIRKIAVQKVEIKEAAKGDFYRECGDMITANLYMIKKGQKSLLAEDFYSGKNEFREIKLDPLKSPQQNAAAYYKKYKKAKNAVSKIEDQLKNGEMELDYVSSVINQIQRIENESDLNEIRTELMSTGYIKSHKQQKIRQNESAPHRFRSSGGSLIYAGRSNIQNDKLTLKTAAKSDLWFHAQKIHGAHVVISCMGASPDDETILEAASIAAYYSAARTAGKVPVDYTLVKNVKKPAGSRPGMVIYNDFKTMIVVQDEELVKRLRENQ